MKFAKEAVWKKFNFNIFLDKTWKSTAKITRKVGNRILYVELRLYFIRIVYGVNTNKT
jgi:hypothetical protein